VEKSWVVVYAVFSVWEGGVISKRIGTSLTDFLMRKNKRRITARRITKTINMRKGKKNNGLCVITFKNPLLEWEKLTVKRLHK
jgi:hypothetical protein